MGKSEEKANAKIEEWAKVITSGYFTPGTPEERITSMAMGVIKDDLLESMDIRMENPYVSEADASNLNTKMVYAYFGVVYDSIIKYINKQKKAENDYIIVIGRHLEIGYTDNTDDDNEKIGSFTPSLHNLYKPGDDFSPTDRQTKSEDRGTEWNSQFSKEFVKETKEIQTFACSEIDRLLNIKTLSASCVIPMWCIIYSNLFKTFEQWFSTEYFKESDPDTYSYEFLIPGAFKLCIRKDKELNNVLGIKECVWDKLAIKSDAKGTAIHE